MLSHFYCLYLFFESKFPFVTWIVLKEDSDFASLAFQSLLDLLTSECKDVMNRKSDSHKLWVWIIMMYSSIQYIIAYN